MRGHDKLEAVLGGKTVLSRSVEALAAAGVSDIVIVTAAERLDRLAGADWPAGASCAVVCGGARRQESVAKGIDAVKAAVKAAAGGAGLGGRFDPVVLVHDAARPLVSPALVRAVASAAATYGAAIPVLPVPETLKRLVGDSVGETVDRTDVVTAQTPQGVRLSLIEQAYREFPADGPETWTDEASLLEACRIPVHAIPGEATNLKVTVPADLERARVLLDTREVASSSAAALPGVSVGVGVDGHSFGPGRPLMLGGVRIDDAPALLGHSDGDAALHAVADALLGAAGLGDLGRLFPADRRTPRGVASGELLRGVVDQVREHGWQVTGVDLTITAARPKLAGLLPQMELAIARTIGIETSAVNVKASTGNLAGSEGAGRSISAVAVAFLVRVPAGQGSA